MSMLAEPRRKQKIINLRAKNNAWSNDNNKFGQRMLEKMGWSVGKGLGANENGIVEHVVARFKNDEKGLGFKDKNDQWTKHEDGFNALLASLSNSGDKNEKLHSGISLEKKSKKSKARVHYHKFTRAKDISQYSEKDLANIFGKTSLKKKIEIKETLKEDVKITEQVFTEKGSMEDYFKSKLSALKSKNESDLGNRSTKNNGNDVDHGFKGFSNADFNTDLNALASTEFSFYNNTSTILFTNTDSFSEQYKTCNKKSKKQKKKNIEHTEENITTEKKDKASQVKYCNFEKDEQELEISKKPNKKKYALDVETKLHNKYGIKKKQKKDKSKEKTHNTVVVNNSDNIMYRSKKKKKKHIDSEL